MKKAKPTVFIVDDDPSVQRAIKKLISSFNYEACICSSAHEFLNARIPKTPSCLVLDVQMPDLNGIDLHKFLIQKQIDIPIIYITGHGDIPMGVNAIKDGAVDFLSKPFQDTDLLGAIDLAIDKDVQRKKYHREIKNIKNRLDTLTPKEVEVLRWIITGKLNKQIALKMGIVEKTVKVHRGRVMHKMRVTSVAELVRLAQKVQISLPKR